MITHAENWADKIPDDEWAVYLPVLEAAQQRGLPFALGGGLAFSYYSGMWRNTKDLDLYIRPSDREAAIGILDELGFTDYFHKVGYDRSWIYRGSKDGLIVDIIWQMANHRAEVDEQWLSGPEINMRGTMVRIIPAEELVFAKLYVLQRERCDWPDLLNVIFEQGVEMNWERLMKRLGDDVPLLAGLLRVFAWLCPERGRELPAPAISLMKAGIGALDESGGTGCEVNERRARLLDGRPWFVPLEKTVAPHRENL